MQQNKKRRYYSEITACQPPSAKNLVVLLTKNCRVQKTSQIFVRRTTKCKKLDNFSSEEPRKFKKKLDNFSERQKRRQRRLRPGQLSARLSVIIPFFTPASVCWMVLRCCWCRNLKSPTLLWWFWDGRQWRTMHVCISCSQRSRPSDRWEKKQPSKPYMSSTSVRLCTNSSHQTKRNFQFNSSHKVFGSF